MRAIGVFASCIVVAAGCSVFPDSLPGSSQPHQGGSGTSGNGSSDNGGSTGDDGSGGGSSGNGGNGDGGTSTGDDGGGGGSKPQPTNDPLAQNIAVTEVAVLQAVKIDVMKDGQAVSSGARNAGVVANRDALIRAYVQGSNSSPITGELVLQLNGQTIDVIKDTKSPSGSSSDASLSSTFNFEVPGKDLPEGVTYSVALSDPNGAARTSQPVDARWPRDGSQQDLGAASTGDRLRIQIVPVQYNADGSGRVPDTSQAQLARYENAFYQIYPTQKVEVTVHAPFAFAQAIDPQGSGWQEVLQALIGLRQQDNPADNVYYMGVFDPSATFGGYCGNGCVAGLCGVGSSPGDASVRACAGIGYSGSEAGLTAAHEVGHAHGRSHSPCGGASGVDPNYPYSGASTGVWGWDIVNHKLIDPGQYTDIMGYCSPLWISDYTYKALFERVQYVNGAHMVLGTHFPTPQPYRFVTIDGSGNAKWGQPTRLNDEPMTAKHTVTLLDQSGAIVGSATGAYWQYDHLPGGFMLVPEPPSGVTSVKIAGPNVNVQLAKTY